MAMTNRQIKNALDYKSLAEELQFLIKENKSLKLEVEELRRVNLINVSTIASLERDLQQYEA